MRRRTRPKRFVVMGEDHYDARALAELLRALCPDAVVKPLRRPIRLRRAGEQVSVIEDKVLPVLLAELAGGETDCIFLHADCDDVEPADDRIARDIESRVQRRLPVAVHAVVPAWELESWWFLWPEACVDVCASWREPSKYVGREVGRIRDAKEELRRELRRVGGGRRQRQYQESDAPRIAGAVRDRGIATEPRARSASYLRFTRAAQQCCGD